MACRRLGHAPELEKATLLTGIGFTKGPNWLCRDSVAIRGTTYRPDRPEVVALRSEAARQEDLPRLLPTRKRERSDEATGI